MIDYPHSDETTYTIDNDEGNRSLNGEIDATRLPMSGIFSMSDDILLTIADQYLTPAERSRLSSCSRRFHSLLKTPLRIKIVNSKGDASLQQGFFVSPADQDDTFTRHILSHENLEFGKKYYFWTFDYERGNRVYLGRHTRHELPSNRDTSYYTLGLRPHSPNQFWMITGGNDGGSVKWGDDIGLSVAGRNTKSSVQPDSTESGGLSCSVVSSSTDTSDSKQWMVLRGIHDGDEKNLRLMPCSMFFSDEDIAEKTLNVHAIAEADQRLPMGGERLLYSPKNQKTGTVHCDGDHAAVDLYFWVSQGIIHVQAVALDFALSMPTLQSDPQCTGLSPLANLLEIISARWDCLVYYVATAADASDGRAVDMERFLLNLTDHPDHTVVYDDIRHTIRIDFPQHEIIRTDVPEVPRDPEVIWKFMLTI